MKDFFVSYTATDEPWAEWIAWQLEQAGYSTVLQAWDFPAGSNFVVEMHKAAAGSERTVPPISDDAEILSELHDQYALGYYPDPDYGDGRWRRLKVRVKPGGLRVRTREGYVDD